MSEKCVFVVTKLSTFTDLHGHKGLLPGLLVRLATVWVVMLALFESVGENNNLRWLLLYCCKQYLERLFYIN